MWKISLGLLLALTGCVGAEVPEPEGSQQSQGPEVPPENGPTPDPSTEPASGGSDEELPTPTEPNEEIPEEELEDTFQVDEGPRIPVDCVESSGEPGSWPDCKAAFDSLGHTDLEWKLGAIVPDVRLFDQYGKQVSLHQFYDHVVIIEISAGWCYPCMLLAAHSQKMYEAHEDEGLVVLAFMINDYDYGTAGIEFVQHWTQEFGLTYPVTYQPRGGRLNAVLRDAGLFRGVIPFNLVIDKDMRLRETVLGNDPKKIDAAVYRYLDE